MKKYYRLEDIEKIKRKVGDDDDDDDLDSIFETGIKKDENRIYFYQEVNKDNVLKLNTTIRNMNNTLLNRSNILSQEPGNIFLHINSTGGGLFDGLLASDIIRTNKVPIITIVDGVAASAATLMSIVGKKRFINKNSFMLIHQLSSGVWGTYHNIKDEKQNCDLLMKTIKKIYKEHTKVPIKKLEQILERDIWLSSEECLEYGLVDEILK
jgi:ATP-dependent Clp endopeptidase proteolytic subunit ClpP